MTNEYFDLGSYSRPITTHSAQCQTWFDRGLIWCYGFNQEEGARCFQRALEYDDECAMAWWGVAYGKGPFYNRVWEAFPPTDRAALIAECHQAVQRALQYSHHAAPVEQALIQALAQRYQCEQVASDYDFSQWDDAYALGMQTAYAAFPTDLDVIALYAEAMMNRTPWQLWDTKEGQPADGADTLKAIEILEKGLSLIEVNALSPHPAIPHLYIHVMEMSPHPEKALQAADALRDLVPESGHLQHMPSHIDLLCGHYHTALVANDKAIVADHKYFAQVGLLDFYTTSCCHDFHFKMFAAMFLGQYQPALDAANAMVRLLTKEVLQVDQPFHAHTLEGYYSTAIHVWVRFGKWQEIVDMPMPDDPELYLVTTVMYHYAKGIAHAALGQIGAAEAERRSFIQAYNRVPGDRFFFNNWAVDTLAVGAEMLNGELAYHKGNYSRAFEHLRRAVELDDNLAYTEPWVWMHPPRHALGALLLAQGHVAEAEAVYRADLGLDSALIRPCQHPDNVWALHGYVECLTRLGKCHEAAAMQLRLDLALARADITIASSCCCRVV